MRVVVLYTPAPADAPPQDLDGLVQRDAVSQALRDSGHQVSALPFELDLARVRSELLAQAPQAVFNLVEAVAGQDRLAQLAPLLLEALRIPFTGCGAEAMVLCADKLLTKRLLGAHGLPTPPWIEAGGDAAPAAASAPAQSAGPRPRMIVKSAFEHGSHGLDDSAVVTIDGPEAYATLRPRLRATSAARGGIWFAEHFVDGRELNLSLIDGPGGVEVLPPAEVRFTGFAGDKPRMVGYDAKWRQASFEYANTVVSFDFAASDESLLQQLRELSVACWRVFGLAGYARVDFRVDAAGQPWVLEINTNPCISPGAGFPSAAARAGLSYAALIERIVVGCTGARLG